MKWIGFPKRGERHMRLTRQNVYYSVDRLLFTQLREKRRQKGSLYIFYAACKIITNLFINYLEYVSFKMLRSGMIFSFRGEKFRYFYSLYNNTWKNERAVEVPIIRRMVEQYEGRKILEIGNVLQHYCTVNHTILDKYETGKGVINEDIISFHPGEKYDLIISISTFEHVGYDEDIKDSSKILHSMDNLRNLLSDKGMAVLTFPLGYNPFLDRFLKQETIKFTRIYCFKKKSRDNRWIEVNFRDIEEAKYGFPFPGANVLIFGIIE